jgi:hypothetical protein
VRPTYTHQNIISRTHSHAHILSHTYDRFLMYCST